jgi:hypothetical protein
LGLGTATPDQRLVVSGNAHITGNLEIAGTISKHAGTFDIPHPDPAKEQSGWRLRHSFVESPTRGDNIYRFEVDITGTEAFIELPEYYSHLNEDAQIWVSPAGHFGRAYARINDDQTGLEVTADSSGKYNVLIIATRKDTLAKGHWDEKGVEYISNR